jgi:hypothetical protein
MAMLHRKFHQHFVKTVLMMSIWPLFLCCVALAVRWWSGGVLPESRQGEGKSEENSQGNSPVVEGFAVEGLGADEEENNRRDFANNKRTNNNANTNSNRKMIGGRGDSGREIESDDDSGDCAGESEHGERRSPKRRARKRQRSESVPSPVFGINDRN